VLRRVVEVEQRLGIPVIGALFSQSGATPPPPRYSTRRTVFRLVTRAAELVLITVMVVLLLATLLDRELAAAFIEDPREAIGQTLEIAKHRMLPH
jgi:hypothetical protein